MGNIFSIQLSGETIITRCWDCVAGQAAFICKLEDNLDALKNEVDKLKARSEGVMRRVRVAEEQEQLKPLTEVEQWCSRAETVIKEADLLIEEGCQQKNKLCMGGCCSRHPKSSHKFGKLIAKKLQEVQDQWRDGDFDTVAGTGPLPSVTKRPSEPTVGLESTFDKVWSSLQEEQVGIIGLYGLGGVGKTTLLNQVNNRFLPNDFDYVIFVVVSQNLKIEKVQEEICKSIGFSDKNKSLDEIANHIWNVLCKKKFVLLLDDIWEHVDLTTVGVPLPTQGNGSKVIFTTRSFDVCCQMEAHKKIEVECLPQGEALKLFEKKVGTETLDGHPEICKLAEEVVKECAGLPLALVTIGRAMASKKTPEEWKYAIEVLRRSVASALPEVRKKMYPKLKFSYDCLPDERVRSCFLYCCLYPEDYLIKKCELIDCWLGEGFLNELSSFRNQGHYLIRSLVDACLLEERDDCVKMHDVIRDMALWIAGESKTEKFWVEAGFQLKEQPVAEKWEKARRVSLMNNEIENLNEIFVCPNLQTLFLGGNELKVIRNGFFKFIPKLRVLDLSKNHDLKKFPVGIAKLVALEHLNLSFTGITNLSYLTLENCEDMEEVKMERAGIASAGCFRSLREVFLFDCSKLRDVSWVIFAPHLEDLFIGLCPNLEEIISEEKVDELMGNSNFFSKLKFLKLGDLPKLKTIYRDALPFPQLKAIIIDRCPMLKRLPLNSDSAKGRKIVIEGGEDWWKEVEWEDEATHTAFLSSFKPLVEY